ncbi:MAG: hypothetical protein LWW86_07820 [Micrococcales bacterium]|nr:hypothetical protein [Micrococcales bacterium]
MSSDDQLLEALRAQMQAERTQADSSLPPTDKLVAGATAAGATALGVGALLRGQVVQKVAIVVAATSIVGAAGYAVHEATQGQQGPTPVAVSTSRTSHAPGTGSPLTSQPTPSSSMPASPTRSTAASTAPWRSRPQPTARPTMRTSTSPLRTATGRPVSPVVPAQPTTATTPLTPSSTATSRAPSGSAGPGSPAAPTPPAASRPPATAQPTTSTSTSTSSTPATRPPATSTSSPPLPSTTAPPTVAPMSIDIIGDNVTSSATVPLGIQVQGGKFGHNYLLICVIEYARPGDAGPTRRAGTYSGPLPAGTLDPKLTDGWCTFPDDAVKVVAAVDLFATKGTARPTLVASAHETVRDLTAALPSPSTATSATLPAATTTSPAH